MWNDSPPSPLWWWLAGLCTSKRQMLVHRPASHRDGPGGPADASTRPVCPTNPDYGRFGKSASHSSHSTSDIPPGLLVGPGLGIPSLTAATPSGSKRRCSFVYRGCRRFVPQPPANCCHPSGVGTMEVWLNVSEAHWAVTGCRTNPIVKRRARTVRQTPKMRALEKIHRCNIAKAGWQPGWNASRIPG